MTELLVLPSLFSALFLTGDNPSTRAASQHAAIAYYKQVGLDEIVEPQLKRFEDKYIPTPFQKAGVGIVFVYRIAMDKRLEFSWSF